MTTPKSLRENFEQAFKDELSPQAYFRGNLAIESAKECALFGAKWAMERLIEYAESVPSAGSMVSSTEIRQLIKGLS